MPCNLMRRPLVFLKTMKKYILIFTLLFFSNLNPILAEKFSVEKVDNPQLKGRRIYAVAHENGKVVWATDNRLFVFENGKISEVFDSSNSPLIEAATISAVGICEGAIWVTQINSSNGYGIFSFDGTAWSIFKDPGTEGILNNRIMKMHVDNDKTLWFGHEVQGVTKMIEAIPLKFANTKIMHLFKNRLLSLHMQLTHLWIGSNNGIVRYRSEISSNYYLNVDTWIYPDFPARAAYSIDDFKYGSIAVGTDVGIAIFDGKSWQMKKKDAGIKALPVLHLCKTPEGLWLGSPIGLQLWRENNPSELLMTDAGLPANRITAMVSDSSGNLFVGTESGACIVKVKK